MYHIKASGKYRCVRICLKVRASVTAIVNNVLGTSLLCNLLQPRLFLIVARCPDNIALFSVKRVQCKVRTWDSFCFSF